MSAGETQVSATKLAAQVAHELNNPLDAVLRFVSLAQRKTQSGNYTDVERHLADAQSGLQRMAETLKQLMDLGRQTHDVLEGGGGGRRERRIPVALEDIIVHARQQVTALAEDCRVAVWVESNVAAGAQPRFDPRLGQVLVNLLRNAVEATPQGGEVRVTVSPTSDCLEIVVADDGPGVSEEVLGQLFTPFVTTKGTGHGLGLAISRELVSAMQGVLKVRNRQAPGRGCVATIVLPVALEQRTSIEG